MPHPVYIGVAWPYANGGLHLGHVAGSLLPPDIFRRYCRMAGHPTLMVSGSDCHGTPILLKAEAEGTSPTEVVDRYHQDHVDALRRLDIDFDLFTRTTTQNHRDWVQRVFLDLLEAGYIEKRVQQAPYDPEAGRFLPDRYVEGTCPHCGDRGARGDQCDQCGKTLDAHELGSPRSKTHGTPVEFRDTEHYFFLLSKLQSKLERFVAATAQHWRPNTVKFTQNWLREGLQDRAITRDLTWGVPIPLEAHEDKRIYVWFEAVCGYLSASVEWAERQGDPEAWMRWWCDETTRAYYFLGKDNIPFHTIIWPAILLAFNEARAQRGEPPLVLPFAVPANEFLNLGGQQFSKSRGIGIGVHEVLDRFEADAVRYYLAANLPEQRDADWTWEDFLAKVNDELVGILGNLVHRTLSFTQKNLGAIPEAPVDSDRERDVVAEIQACGDEMALHIGAVQLKRGLRRLLEFAGWGNQVMQETAPWRLLKEDRAEGERALYSLLRVVKALSVYMAPFLPAAAQRAWSMLGEEGSVHEASWKDAGAPLRSGHHLEAPKALIRKLDPKELPREPSLPADGSKEKDQDAGQAETASGSGAKAAKATAKPSTAASTTEASGNGQITIDDFARLQLRLATVLGVEEHPKADRLYVLRLDVGELGERQVVAGLKAYYGPEDLVGQTVAFVANLRPVRLRGVESQGMILAADAGDEVAVLNPQRPLPAGSRIR